MFKICILLRQAEASENAFLFFVWTLCDELSKVLYHENYISLNWPTFQNDVKTNLSISVYYNIRAAHFVMSFSTNSFNLGKYTFRRKQGKRANPKTGFSRKQSSQNFPKNEHSLPPDTNSYACVSGIKKCSFCGKFDALFFLETPALRYALLPYYPCFVLSSH